MKFWSVALQGVWGLLAAYLAAASLAQAETFCGAECGVDCGVDCGTTLGPPIEVERGKDRPVVDAVGWVLGIPEKVLLWDRRANNHDVSPATEDKAVEYLAAKGATGTKVRVNQYAPLDEFRRLRDNEAIHPGWKYTVGGLYTLGYTVFPGRIMGNDSYNPYTDTINLYSDIPALAMEQAAFAADVKGRENPGTYAAVQSLPLISLGHERRNKQDVFEHVDAGGEMSERVEARRVLHAQFGSEAGGQIGSFVEPVQGVVQAAGAAIGHIVGRREVRRLEESPEATPTK